MEWAVMLFFSVFVQLHTLVCLCAYVYMGACEHTYVHVEVT